MPVSPSTRTRAPSGMDRVAPVAETTQGMPSSRLTITAWLSGAPDVDDDGGRRHEQRRPGRVGDRRHEHVAGIEGARVGRVEHDARHALDHARAARDPLQGVARRESLRRSSASRRGHVASGSGGSPTNTNGGSRADSSSYSARRWRTSSVKSVRVGDEGAVQLGLAQEAEVLDLVEGAPLHHPPPELAHRHAGLVDEADVVRLRPLARRQPHGGRPQGGGELAVRRGSASTHRRGSRPRPPARAAACGDWWASGAALSGDSRIRSMAASASSGRVSQVGDRISHSFGPREPYSCRKTGKPRQEGLRGLAAAAPRGGRSARRTPASKAAVQLGDAATTRPSSHSAIDGAAESTSPTPAMRTMSRSGLPDRDADAAG